MTTIKYEINGEMVEIEVEDSFASAYVEVENDDRRAEERHKWHKRKNLTELDAIEEMGGQIADPTSDFEDDYLDREEMAQAIAQLSAEQQDLIRRVYFNGEKQTDISRELGVGKSAIANRLTRALAQLKKYFENN